MPATAARWLAVLLCDAVDRRRDRRSVIVAVPCPDVALIGCGARYELRAKQKRAPPTVRADKHDVSGSRVAFHAVADGERADRFVLWPLIPVVAHHVAMSGFVAGVIYILPITIASSIISEPVIMQPPNVHLSNPHKPSAPHRGTHRKPRPAPASPEPCRASRTRLSCILAFK